MDKTYAQYLLKKIREDYNLIAGEFSSKREQPWPETKFLFDNYIKSGDMVLDLGCGNGRFFEFIKDSGAEYIGLDSSEKLIEIAKIKYSQAKFQTADALNLPFPDNYFDKVYSIAVLHHIPSKELRIQFLEEVKRVLKPGGLFIATVWKFHRPESLFLIFKFTIAKILGLSRLDFGDIFEPWGKKLQRYYHCFSKKELAHSVREAGFGVRKVGVIANERGNRRNIYIVAKK